jgi:hypothetical protein
MSFRRNYFHKHEKCLWKDGALNIWIFGFYLEESPSGIVGSETWGNAATKIVILDKPVPHCRKSNVTTC